MFQRCLTLAVLNCILKLTMFKHLLFFLLLISAGTLFAQDKVIFQFDNVEKAIYNYSIESFQDSGETQVPGQIEIHFDKKAVVIDCQNDEDDKQLSIIEKNDDSKPGDMYICSMDGQYYAFTVSKDKSELTLVSADHRFIYKLKK